VYSDAALSRQRMRRSRGAWRFNSHYKRINIMLYTIAVVLLILWLLGFVSAYTIGGLIHILLVVAVVMILVGFISGRRSL
jgi:hypothetical protein